MEPKQKKDKIVCIIQPFVALQTIYVYHNEEIITATSPINDLSETLYKLCKNYDIQKVEIGGTIPYSEIIKKEFVSKYEDFPINIENI